jgi:hypothetical protein
LKQDHRIALLLVPLVAAIVGPLVVAAIDWEEAELPARRLLAWGLAALTTGLVIVFFLVLFASFLGVSAPCDG